MQKNKNNEILYVIVNRNGDYLVTFERKDPFKPTYVFGFGIEATAIKLNNLETAERWASIAGGKVKKYQYK